VQRKLCSVLELKGNMGIRIRECYKNREFKKLKYITDREIPELCRRVGELRNAHRKQWMSTYKPFGWEVLDIRYGGIMARLDTIQKRLSSYIERRISVIEELEEEKLYFDDSVADKKSKTCCCNSYERIVTTGLF
jgi:hypothetical protein